MRGRLQARHLRQVQHAVCWIVLKQLTTRSCRPSAFCIFLPHLPNAAAEVRHLWHFHQFQWFQFTSSTQILSTHGSIQNCYWGAHAIGSGPLADWIAALDFHRSQFQWGFTMGLTWSCALWIKPVGCQTFTASSVTRVAKCGLLGIWRFYPCLFGIIMIGGPWWPRFAPFFTKGSSRGATLSFTLRSKGEGGQPRYLILQEIASHFSTPPPVFVST